MKSLLNASYNSTRKSEFGRIVQREKESSGRIFGRLETGRLETLPLAGSICFILSELGFIGYMDDHDKDRLLCM